MARNWTPEQRDAIYTKWIAEGKSSNILVNAAAGSGKTAVLVERIIEKLSENEIDQTVTDLDRLLVVTFTNAAAAEMKERISAAIREQIRKAEKEKDYTRKQYLKKQAGLLHSADITTIDAFCMRMVRRYFHLLGIDPNFKIAGQEAVLLQDEVMEELFDECYEKQDEGFFRLLECYSESRDDAGLSELVLQLFQFTRSLPNPEEWLLMQADRFLQTGEENPWFSMLYSEVIRYASVAKEALEQALWHIFTHCMGEVEINDYVSLIQKAPPEAMNPIYLTWESYYTAVVQDYQLACKLVEADWDEGYRLLSAHSFLGLTAKPVFRDKTMQIQDKEKKAKVKELRDAGKELLQKASATLYLPMPEIENQLNGQVYQLANALCRLVLEFARRYEEKKLSRNMLEFYDVEHLCLRLFREHPEVREELKARYTEILMDEYQDTNGLQEAIFREISTGDNFFMVGDMKQSIYRFRSSDPTIFKEKSDTYLMEEGAENRKIVLSANFRSRGEVLSAVNVIFESIMSETVGEVVYDNQQRLNLGNKTYEQHNQECCRGYQAECYLLEGPVSEVVEVDEDSEEEGEESLDLARLEARFIARKIREMKENGYLVRDGDSYRPIQNRDFTILMSSHKSVGEVYQEELEAAGVACYAEIGGYFERNEVRMVLSLMKVLQNPQQDIPLLGVLRSPIGQFSDALLSRIRASGSGSIYSALCRFARSEEEGAEQCRTFLKKLDSWRNDSRYMRCDRFLWMLYEETGIYSFVGALPDGAAAQANLRLLFERAVAYEQAGYRGLFQFSNYMERLQMREEDLNAAKSVGEEHDVVRIMTIHKSKGLEFPVVFLASCCKKFNTREKKLALHRILGLGIDCFDLEKSVRIPSVASLAIKAQNRREAISEEVRKLYVALTRAKEKLIVVGSIKGPAHVADSPTPMGAYLQKWDRIFPEDGGTMSETDAGNAKCFMDWVGPVASLSDVWHFEAVTYKAEKAEAEEAEESADEQNPEPIVVEQVRYAYAGASDLPTKVSVTELKQQKSTFSNLPSLSERPAFLQEESLTATERGTAIHVAMQEIRPKEGMDISYIRTELTRLVEEEILSHEEVAFVEAKKILAFYESDLGKRLLCAMRVWREAPFEIEIPAKTFYPDAPEEEQVMLQGVIDCFFEEEDGIVLLDFKSDFYRTEAEMLGKYAFQLDCYAQVIEKMLQKNVKNQFLYLFFDDHVLQCN